VLGPYPERLGDESVRLKPISLRRITDERTAARLHDADLAGAVAPFGPSFASSSLGVRARRWRAFFIPTQVVRGAIRGLALFVRGWGVLKASGFHSSFSQ
jgi:hypothetical protein